MADRRWRNRAGRMLDPTSAAQPDRALDDVCMCSGRGAQWFIASSSSVSRSRTLAAALIVRNDHSRKALSSVEKVHRLCTASRSAGRSGTR